MDPILFARCDPVETFGVAPAAMEAAEAPVVVWEALDGEPRPSLDGIGGVVLFGSSYNVEHADQQPFIKDARELTLEAIDRGVPYLGVCFGAQLLAWSLDADVMKAPAREVGFEVIHPTAAAADDPVLSHFTDGDLAFQWHMDTFDVPSGGALLATGDRVTNQAYRVGDRTWGVQFHFEIIRTEMDLWLDAFEREDGPLESSWGKSASTIRAEADRYLAAHEARGSEVFTRFATFSRSIT
jgi:GMP synthase-like glutamine amidotransferase